MSWQIVTADDLARSARPLVSIEGLPQGASTYELTAPTQVKLVTGLPEEGKMEIHYTLDGAEPSVSSLRYEAPFTIDKTCQLRARIFSDGKPVGEETSISFTRSPVPTLGLLGVWNASKTSSNAIVNQVPGKAGDLPIAVGTVIQDDPEQGKTFVLDHSSPIILSHPAILENHLSLVFRIQPTGSGNLISETYGPKGLFADVNPGLGLHAGGGGSYNVVQTAPNILGDKAWHTVDGDFRRQTGTFHRTVPRRQGGGIREDSRSLPPTSTHAASWIHRQDFGNPPLQSHPDARRNSGSFHCGVQIKALAALPMIKSSFRKSIARMFRLAAALEDLRCNSECLLRGCAAIRNDPYLLPYFEYGRISETCGIGKGTWCQSC